MKNFLSKPPEILLNCPISFIYYSSQVIGRRNKRLVFLEAIERKMMAVNLGNLEKK
jgi:hypothetical protein